MKALLLGGTGLGLALAGYHLSQALHFLQLQEYQNGRFLGWWRRHWRRLFWPAEVAIAVALLAVGAAASAGSSPAIAYFGLGLWIFGLASSVLATLLRRAPAVKPLVYTARARRILVAALLLALVQAAVAARLLWGFPLAALAAAAEVPSRVLMYLGSITLIAQIAPLNMPLANAVLYPVEATVQAYYARDARRRIGALRPFVIGITGSYGKTSTKEILAHMLSSRHAVLKTPRSFNTVAGICKTIRQDLQPRHRYFVVELGAYRSGEIARLCRLVSPSMGILTAVGPQHLERFKTVEAVARAKSELLQALPRDGVAIVNADDPVCARLGAGCRATVRRYGLQEGSQPLDVTARNVTVDGSGTRFDMIRPGQAPQPVRTALLGRHNVSNILAASLAALECGLSLRELSQALASLPPVEHRLQLLPSAHGVITIDDAYNSNPVGAAAALEVLGSFAGRKILVTPGMVELGPAEAEENRQLGRNAAAVCDYVFLVGSGARVDAIAKGLRGGRFDETRVTRVANLAEGRVRLRELVRPGDVVLFENDLPDTY